MYDTVIIGAGMSGLAAGIRLAHYNKKVCILEQHSTIGGLNSFYRQRGRDFDVGLHAMTNYTPKGTKHGPLTRIFRLLRFTFEDFALVPQVGSEIAFAGVRLQFNNQFELFESEVSRAFPGQADGLRKMVSTLVGYDQLGLGTTGGSAREFVSQHITDPLLAEMIFCPILYYGGARERDMEFGQFCIMFRSIFLEGFARPIAGVRLILQKLHRKFKALGGELRLRVGVEKLDVTSGRVRKVILSDGTELETENVLSSAGWFETMRLCSDMNQEPAENDVGQLAFVETISVLDKEPKQLGHKQTIVFFNDSDKFEYTKPADLVDLRSGVICSPNNFDYEQPLSEGMIRITALANFDAWAALDETTYRLEKLRWYDKTLASAVRFVPDFRGSIVEADMFTPLTIHRYTGKRKGAIYGAPEKRYTGQTHLENLYVCGTDQGMVGIIGAIVSGITITSKYLLK